MIRNLLLVLVILTNVGIAAARGYSGSSEDNILDDHFENLMDFYYQKGEPACCTDPPSHFPVDSVEECVQYCYFTNLCNCTSYNFLTKMCSLLG